MKEMTSNYITCRLQGRTGHIMFQIANGYAQSLKHNRQFVVPSKESTTSHLEKGLFRKFDFRINTIPSTEVAQHIWAPFTYKEFAPSEDRPTAFCGWYQSEKYFGNYKEVIRDAFSPTTEFVIKATNEFPFLNSARVAAINVRRGDYLTQPRHHPVVTLDYIEEARKLLPPHDYLMVLSDDFEWCKNNIKGNNIIFPTNYVDQDAMWLLSMCDDFIISNSTFSWWGAFLSRTKNKVVISPSTWFGPDIHEDPSDVWCEGWIKIPTKWKDGFIVMQ